MGDCCSRFLAKLSGSSTDAAVETEMTPKTTGGKKNANGELPPPPLLAIDEKMSAPTVLVEDGSSASGSGLALVGVSIEQDAAYWEWQVEIKGSASGEALEELKFGVSTRKTQKFYKALELHEEDTSLYNSQTALMKSIPELKDGDVVGVAVQQSDLPMVQFFLNGEPLHDLAINRFRGTVFPAVFLCEGVTVKPIFDEESFAGSPPHSRFGPLIEARGLF